MPFVTTVRLRAGLKSSVSFRFTRFAASGIGLLLAAPLLASPSLANPTGAMVATGSASIAVSSPGKTQIDQKSEDVVIDWSSFNIGSGQTTTFVQPNAQAIAVNRIGGAKASQILGTLDANGRVVLINGNGLLFGKGSQVNVGSLIATSTDGTDSDLLAGKFSNAGNQSASVVNRGTITAASYGTVALVAPNVTNTGTVQAKLGTVSLGGANAFTVDFKGDGLVSFAAQGDVNGRASATNKGLLSGANVTMTARAAEGLATGVVDMRGIIEAKTAHQQGGTIVLDAGDGGDTIVAHARLDASGANGGGAIDIGGWNEASATVDKSSVLDASARRTGNGGNISVIANATSFEGRALAQGGKTSGNGGMIETSGYVIDAQGARVDALALHGNSGLWSLDPEDVTISTATTTDGTISGGIFTPSGDNSVLNVATLEAALATGNVDVTTGSVGSQPGNITVAAPIAWSNSRLKLDAFGDIDIDAAITGSSAALILVAGGLVNQSSGAAISVASLSGSTIGAVTLTAINQIGTLGTFATGGGDFALTDNETLTVTGAVNAGTGDISLTTTGAGDGIVLAAGLTSADTVDLVSAGTIAHSSAGIITATNFMGSSVGNTLLTGANEIADLDGFTTTTGKFALSDDQSLTISGTVNAGNESVALTDTGSIAESGAGAIDAGSLSGGAASGAAFDNTNRIAILDAFTNAGGSGFALTTDRGLTVDGAVNAGTGDLSLTTVGTGNNLIIAEGLRSDGTVDLVSAGAIGHGAAGIITANTLTGSSAGNTSLTAANQIQNLGAFTNIAGSLSLTDDQALTIDGLVTAGTHAVTFTDTGPIAESDAGAIMARTLEGSSVGGASLTGANQIAAFQTFVNHGAGGLSLTENESITLNSVINAGTGALTLSTVAAGQDITIATAQSASTFNVVSAGAITVNVPLTVAGTGSLTLNAAGDLDINKSITVSGAGSVALDAGPDTTTAPGASFLEMMFAPGTSLSFGATNEGGSLSIEGQPYTLLYSMSDVQNITNNLNANYALATSLDASSVTSWMPIGDDANGNELNNAMGLNGNFEGLGHTISNFSITLPDDPAAALIGDISGTLRDVGMIGGTVSGENAGDLASGANIVVNCYATGSVTATGGGYFGGAGGLILGAAFVIDSYATGKVSGYQYLGGLESGGGTIINSFATGAVSGFWAIGGLAGDVNGLIENSHASGRATGTGTGVYNAQPSNMGGLVGITETSSDVVNSYATGAVRSSGGNLGGLIGLSQGPVSGSYATGSVTGSDNDSGSYYVGGLVGEAGDAEITNSHATGNVRGGFYAGGLIGDSGDPISNSYATGTVSGLDFTGGLTGESIGAVSNSFATGAISGSYATGGLLGSASGDVSNSYATGTVTSANDAGGLIGVLTNSSTISDSYAIGFVKGTMANNEVHGFLGLGTPIYINNYWDTDTSGANGGSAPGYITGLTTAQLQAGLPTGFSPTIWGENANINGGFPYLIATPPPS